MCRLPFFSGRTPAACLGFASLLAVVGCAEPPPAAPPRKPVAVTVVEDAAERAAPSAEPPAPVRAAVRPEPAAESVAPAAENSGAVATRAQVTKLLAALAAAGDDSRLRVTTIDQIAALPGDAELTLGPLVAALGDAESRVRWHAARAIGLLGRDGVTAIPAIVKLLADSDPVVVTQAAAAIAHIRADDERDPIPEAAAAAYASTIDPLVAALVHPDPRPRRAAIRALRGVSTSRQELAKTVRRQLADADPTAVMPALHTLADLGADAVPFLVESLDDPASRYWAEVVLAEIGPAAAPAVDALTRLAREGEIPEQVQSILALAEIGPAAAPAVPVIVESLGSEDESLQYVAAFALGKIGAADADEALRREVASDDTFLATLASWALAKIHPDDATLVADAADRLRAGLSSESPAVRNAAVEGLSDLAPRFEPADRHRLAEAFAGLLVDPVPSVGLAAGGGLIRLGADSVVALRQTLADPLRRNDALEILAAIGPPALPALDQIVAALADADPVCRADAAFAIGGIGPAAEAAVPALQRVLEDESVDGSARYTAAYALGKIGPEASGAEPLLKKLADSGDDLLATVSVWAALKINPHDKELFERAVPKLRRALQGDQELVRLEAAVALGEIGPPAASALPMLELLAEDDPSRQVREAAEASIGRIRN